MNHNSESSNLERREEKKIMKISKFFVVPAIQMRIYDSKLKSSKKDQSLEFHCKSMFNPLHVLFIYFHLIIFAITFIISCFLYFWNFWSL